MMFLYFTILFIKVFEIRSDKITYLKIIDAFDTFKILKGLRHFNNLSVCGNHMAEYLNGLQNDEYWATVSK